MIKKIKEKDVFKRFQRKKILDSGDFSSIYKVLEINTKKEYALKIINYRRKDMNYLICCIKIEIKIVNECKCENIVEIW